jgi:hypothetical protein
MLEAPGGVEPPTNGLGNRCSIQLSYGAKPSSLLHRLQFTTVAFDVAKAPVAPTAGGTSNDFYILGLPHALHFFMVRGA